MTPKTIIVTGTEFSGTSFVAGMLRILGIQMGEEFYPSDTHQDKVFNSTVFTESTAKSITDRNKRFPVWGFKQVNLSYWFDEAITLIRNPHLIVCCRSLTGCLSSNSKYLVDKKATVRAHAREVNYLCSLMLRPNVSTLLLEYADSSASKIEAIASFLKLSPSTDQLEKIRKFDTGGAGYSVIN